VTNEAQSEEFDERKAKAYRVIELSAQYMIWREFFDLDYYVNDSDENKIISKTENQLEIMCACELIVQR